MSAPRWWKLLQERGGKWPDTAAMRALDPIVPACATHAWSPWREQYGHFDGPAFRGSLVWQTARCSECGRVACREVYLRKGRRERVLGDITVTDVGAIPTSMVPLLRQRALDGDFW